LLNLFLFGWFGREIALTAFSGYEKAKDPVTERHLKLFPNESFHHYGDEAGLSPHDRRLKSTAVS
jgi:hypothetical protein